MNSAPEIASRVREVVDRASELLDEAQREDLSATIAAVRDVSQQLAKRDEEIGRMLEDAAASAQSMDRAARQLNRLIEEDLQQLVSEGEAAASSLADLTAEMERFLAEYRQPVREMTTEGFVEARHLINEARILVEDLSQVAQMLRENPDAFLFGDRAGQFRPDSGQ